MAKNRKVNLKVISDMTGFSTATISNALNHKRGVNADTAAEIFRVATELGYIGEDTVSQIRFIIFRKTGAIIDDTPFFSLMIDGIERECRAQGLEILLSHLNQQDRDYAEQVRWIIHDSAAAIIILGTELSESDLLPYRAANRPILTLDFWSRDMSLNGVVINNTDSARMAVDYLIGKGHREIGYLCGNFRIDAFREREYGYKSSLKRAQIPYNSDYSVTLGTTFSAANMDMLEYLRKSPKLPTAYFADNDLIALGAMRALQEFGKKIPEDISIVGFDDLSYSGLSVPPLTTVRVPKQEMGRMAVRRLMEVVRDDSKTVVKIQLGTRFVERRSVADLTKAPVPGNEENE